jgi:hypothetical protein
VAWLSTDDVIWPPRAKKEQCYIMAIFLGAIDYRIRINAVMVLSIYLDIG